MREIKFRGRDDEGQWHFGFLSWYSDVLACICDGADYEVDPETVGQSTGLRDANQREIYEGDIVQFPAFPFAKGVVSGIVKYEYGQFLMIYDCFRYAIFSVINDVKVLGNIHDNPSLLEETR